MFNAERVLIIKYETRLKIFFNIKIRTYFFRSRSVRRRMWETLARYLNFDFIDKQTQQKIDPTKSNRPLSPSLTHRSLAASVDEPMSLEAEEKALSRSINI
jgi:hypothetical protein